MMDVTNSTLPEDPQMPLQANVALSTALGINFFCHGKKPSFRWPPKKTTSHLLLLNRLYTRNAWSLVRLYVLSETISLPKSHGTRRGNIHPSEDGALPPELQDPQGTMHT